MTVGNTLLVILLAVPVIAGWAYALVDLLRRTDQKAWRKAVWIAAIVLLPIVGPILYLVLRPSRRGDIRGFGGRRAQSKRADRLLNGDDPDAG